LKTPPSEIDIQRIMGKYLDVETDVARSALLDTLGRVALANVIERELRERHWFPVQSHDQAMLFWKQPAASSLNIGAVSGSADQGATFTELTSRFLQPLRISINTVIASGKDSTVQAQTTPGTSTAAPVDTGASATAISRFLNGGGLLNIAMSFPFVHYGLSNGAADFIGVIAPRVGGTLPVLGASARDTTMMYDAGPEFFFKSGDYIDGIGVFFQSRIALAGGTSRFMSLIGDANRSRTWYQTLSAGLSLDDKYLITLNRAVSGPHAIQRGWQVGITLARAASASTVSSP
jgi:hypothetical protein